MNRNYSFGRYLVGYDVRSCERPGKKTSRGSEIAAADTHGGYQQGSQRESDTLIGGEETLSTQEKLTVQILPILAAIKELEQQKV